MSPASHFHDPHFQGYYWRTGFLPEGAHFDSSRGTDASIEKPNLAPTILPHMKTFLPLFIALTSFALADGLPTVPYLYVRGSAEVEKKADLVSLAFTLSATDADATKANSTVQTQAVKVFAHLKTVGVADEDVIAGDIESNAEYENSGGYGARGKFLGYRVQRELTVKIRDLVKFPKLVNDLFALNVRYFKGVTEEYSKARETEQETEEMAMKNARAEADKMAKATGMKLDSIWAISSEPFPEIQNHILGYNVFSTPLSAVEAPKKSEVAPEYRIPSVKFYRDVRVIYLISPAK
jgi:uncharacterized protein YggE